MFGAAGGRPQDFERVARTVHVGGIGGLGETISEQDVADFFGQQGACDSRRRPAVPRKLPRVAALGSADAAWLALPPGEVKAVRISGRFCWVEFADVRAAHAALECVPKRHRYTSLLTCRSASAPRAQVAAPRAQYVLTCHVARRLDGTVTGGHHLRVSQSKSAIHSNGLKKRVRALGRVLLCAPLLGIGARRRSPAVQS